MATELQDTADRLFADLLTPAVWQGVAAGAFPTAAWATLTEAGLTAALLPEHAGGFGATTREALALLHTAGAHACPLPLAETMLAGWLLARSGLPVPDGPLAITSDPIARDIPWGRAATALVVLSDAGIGLAPAWTTEPGLDIAAEPRDTLRYQPPRDTVPCPITPLQLRAAAAATRTLLIAGALDRITTDTIAYAQTRKQFGKPIGRLQVMQQSLAVLATQSAAATAASDLAAEAMDPPNLPAIAAAKTRAGEAAGIGAAIAHQVHGAIGFTEEHHLHRFTRRLWAWRDEHGTEAEWSLLLGRHLAAAGPDRLWATVTSL